MLLLMLSAVAFTCFALETSASSHWVVTERGRIEAKDNMFDMRNPEDLVGFLELEDKIEHLFKLMTKKDMLLSKRLSEEWQNKKLVEDSMMSTECKTAIPIEDCNFYFSTSLAENEYKTLLHDDIAKSDDLPFCKPLNFSIHFYEHLQSMQDREGLKMKPEKILLHSEDLDSIGFKVAAHLKANESSYQLFNLATLFWRAKGDAPNAINCIRQALLLAPISARHISLLHLGNVLHQSTKSGEAAIILHAAIDHSARDAKSHWTLGNVYSVLGDFQRAIMCYDNAHRLEKSLHLVEKNLIAVKCHSMVNQALSEATNRLQELLEDLEDTNLLKQEKSRIEGLVNKYKAISSVAERNLGTEVGNSIMLLDNRLKGLVDMVQTLSDNLDFEKRVLTKPDPADGECLSLEDINVSVIYASFEHRILESLNEELGLQRGENHPLPWHPPTCEEQSSKKHPQIPSHVMSQYLTPSKSNKLKPQPELMKHLQQFVHAELKADEELGHRIHEALKRELGSRGLLRTFAGLYWYARGDLSQATNCFLSSLHMCPENDSVVPLTALSSMLMSLGHSDGAVYLALKGVNSKMSDVGGNVLLASLYLLRSDFKNSKLHLQQAFLHRPRGHLRSVALAIECHIRNLNEDDECCENDPVTGLPSTQTLDQCIKLTKNK